MYAIRSYCELLVKLLLQGFIVLERGFGQIERDNRRLCAIRLRDRIVGLFERFLLPVEQHQRGTVLRECQRGYLTDAGGRASDQDYTVGKQIFWR